MPGPKSLDQELHAQVMSEMAQSFFSRRKDMDDRLEKFSALAHEVLLSAKVTLRCWRSVFLLLVDETLAKALLKSAQAGPPDLAALAAQAGGLWSFRRPWALTNKGRLRKALAKAYAEAHAATVLYRDGAYAPDPRDPRRMRLSPSRQGLVALAEDINRDIKKINQDQCPSTVLGYIESLDSLEAERGNITGGLMGQDACFIDREMAFKPLDFAALNLPDIPVPTAPGEMKTALDQLADQAFGLHPKEALEALAQVAAHRE